MKKHLFQLSGMVLMMLAVSCSRAPEPKAQSHALDMDEQLMAALPLVDEGMVMQVCSNVGSESLSFSFVAEKPDPANPGQTLAVDPIPTEKQLAAILQVVDEHHMVKVHQETDEASGEPHVVFSVERRN